MNNRKNYVKHVAKNIEINTTAEKLRINPKTKNSVVLVTIMSPTKRKRNYKLKINEVIVVIKKKKLIKCIFSFILSSKYDQK